MMPHQLPAAGRRSGQSLKKSKYVGRCRVAEVAGNALKMPRWQKVTCYDAAKVNGVTYEKMSFVYKKMYMFRQKA